MAINSKQVGRAIRRLREGQDLTQEELASRVGLTQNYICLIETGNRAPSAAVMAKLAESFELPLSFLMFLGEDFEAIKDNDIRSLAEEIGELIFAATGLDDGLSGGGEGGQSPVVDPDIATDAGHVTLSGRKAHGRRQLPETGIGRVELIKPPRAAGAVARRLPAARGASRRRAES